MDLSGISTEDLLALKAGDLSKVSTPGLQALRHASASDAVNNDAISQSARDVTGGMGTLDKFNAGVGKTFSDLALGVKQRLGMASRDDVTEARRLDAPLMNTTAGKVGNVAGNFTAAVPASLVPGAGTVPAAAALSGLIGLLQPSASVKEDVLNTGLAAAGGAAGQYVANLAGGAAASQQSRNATQTAQNTQKTQAAQNASQAGYVIPPEDLGQGGGLVTKILSGVGGKIKTAQEASLRNQSTTNALARSAVGLPEDAPLTVQALDDIRRSAGKAYGKVAGLGELDAAGAQLPQEANVRTYTDALLNRRTTVNSADLVNVWKQANADANGYYAAYARDANPETLAKAKAAAAASNQISDFLESSLQKAGNSDLLQALRDARVQIAKTYSVQKGLNTTTGDVAANALARQLDKGKPLSGDLLTIAQAGQAFPKATQALKEAPKSLSPLDMALAVIQRDPMGLLTLGARPAARSLLLSRPMQQSALDAAATPQPANALLRALAQQQLTMPAGYTGGNALAQVLAP